MFLFSLADQRLDLCKLNSSDSDAVRGQIVGKDGFIIELQVLGNFVTMSYY